MAKFPKVNGKHQLTDFRNSGNSEENKHKARTLHEFARAAGTRCHCWWFSHCLQAGSPRPRGRRMGFSRGPSPSFADGRLLACPHAAFSLSVCTSRGVSLCPSLLVLWVHQLIELWPALRVWFYLNQLLKYPLSKYSLILTDQGFSIGSMGDTIQPIIHIWTLLYSNCWIPLIAKRWKDRGKRHSLYKSSHRNTFH